MIVMFSIEGDIMCSHLWHWSKLCV